MSDPNNSLPTTPHLLNNTVKTAGFWRRMAAIFYDSLLLLATYFVATAIALPLNNGEAFESAQYLYSVYLIVISFAYFGWFWTHGGQTPGMKAWKLMLISTKDSKEPIISWKLAAKRFIAALLSWAILGIGFAVILFNKLNLALHDRLSSSRIVYSG